MTSDVTPALDATSPDAPSPDAEARPSRRRWPRLALFVVLALLWIRFALFGWLFPLIEQHVDNPEFDPTESSIPSEDAG